MAFSAFLEAFRSYGGDVENLLLAEVASNDSYDRFLTIMGRINKHMFLAFAPKAVLGYMR